MIFPPGLAERLYVALNAMLPGLSVELVQSCDSTNTRLLERARQGDESPCLMAAAEQTAGRGRMGRSWASSPGDSLTFSLGLPMAPADWSGLSLVVGIALAQALHPRVRIKWPNDLWLDERKLAGILVETGGSSGGRRHAVIGVGINVKEPTVSGLSVAPACLRDVVPGVEAADVLEQVATPLLKAVLAFERDGFEPWRVAFAQRDALAGRELMLSDGTSGRAGGVGSNGALLLHTADGLREVTSSEVSVRPAGSR